MQIRLSRYGQASTEPSPVNRMMTDFAHDFRDGVDVNLGVGYVNEQTIPVALLKSAMDAVAGDPLKHRQAFNYGSAAGSPNLIASVRSFLSRRAGPVYERAIDARRVAIGACGATSILEALSAIMQPGIVVTSDPAYYIYSDALERSGFEILAVPEDADGPDLGLLESKLAALGPRAREISFFYVVTVGNPSSTILSNARRMALLECASALSREQNRQIPIFFDLAYELLLHDPAVPKPESALPADELGIAYEIGTLSKILAPAMRIGYILGPDGPLMNALVQKTSDTGFSAPLFVQEMASHLLDSHAEEQLAAVNAGYRQKAQAVRAGIEAELGSYLAEVRGGSAGFYFYLEFRDIETHPGSAFFRFLTRTTGDPGIDGPAGNPGPRAIYIPGVYCVHPRGDLAERGRRQLRLSYGFEEAARIVQALAWLREAAEYA